MKGIDVPHHFSRFEEKGSISSTSNEQNQGSHLARVPSNTNVEWSWWFVAGDLEPLGRRLEVLGSKEQSDGDALLISHRTRRLYIEGDRSSKLCRRCKLIASSGPD
ncbi:unnamed protein product [Lactuca virosa]|uniref:Uncharacterized protein n=1 Tax=Lactuca virosa TaxID=75947 RepID=A0AAU9MTH8_9ASTR|nr:unnamed protein product [Lactuca virosa]